jgi:glycosyltransferase involved in cell wall biosynthesis
MKDRCVSIVLPVYNQADHISTIVNEYEAVLGQLPNGHELILVTNGCRDRSVQICEALAREYGPVRALNSDRPGWGLAVRLGLSQAQGDLLCYTNSARTNPQDLILILLYAIVYPNVVIKANRKIRDNWFRRLGSLLYNLECRSLFDLSYWDINGTPKVFPRSFGKLLRLSYDNDLIDAEFNVICRREGYPLLEVPILSTRRHGGKSTTGIGSALRLYWGAFQMSRKLAERGR